jgi:hypothetical protein
MILDRRDRAVVLCVPASNDRLMLRLDVVKMSPSDARTHVSSLLIDGRGSDTFAPIE